MYRHEQSEVVTAGEAVSSWMITPMVILTIGILLLGVWPSLISKITIPAANIFLSPFGF
jgi:formate hydrogenlyase subunit 3/multisubunit Na+/H+ antiporter MnhD subunit